MSKVLMIPNDLKVGFQYRENATTKKLSYIIYYDEKNKLRKEKSFNSWIDHKIPTVETKNKVISGFRILTNIKRNPYHFGDATEKVRIFDPRGFEFEISISNLIFLFDHGNLIDLEYQGECVFAWDGTELVLLPVNSLVYKENTAKMENITKNVKAKDLIVGASYSLKKKNEEYVYLGHYYYCHDFNLEKSIDALIRKLNVNKDNHYISCEKLRDSRKKTHIFLNLRRGFFELTSLTTLNTLSHMINKEAISLEDMNALISIPLISDKGFEEGVEDREERKGAACFFEDEKYELFLSRDNSYYSTRFRFLLIDKLKNKIIKEDNMSDEEERYVNKHLNNFTEEGNKKKYIMIGDQKHYIRL